MILLFCLMTACFHAPDEDGDGNLFQSEVPSEERYAEDYTEALCNNLASCEADVVSAYVELGMDQATAQSVYDSSYADACGSGDPIDGVLSDDCNFDSSAAKQCLRGVEALSCQFWVTGSGYPQDCDDVCG